MDDGWRHKTADQTKADRRRRADSNNKKDSHAVTTNIPWASVLHSDPRGKETHTQGGLWDASGTGSSNSKHARLTLDVDDKQ